MAKRERADHRKGVQKDAKRMAQKVTPMEKFTRAAELAGGKSGKRSSNGWVRFPHPCNPAGDDALSFAVTEKPDGSVDIASHKGKYDHDDCLAALGLTRADFFPESDIRGPVVSGKGICTHQYEYADTKGKLVGAVKRVHNGEKKIFPQGRYEAGKWVSGLGSVKLPLFESAKVADAIKRGETIYITEGEKDALAMWKAGFVATTKSGGAGKPWDAHLIEALKGANLIVVIDKDEAGLVALMHAYEQLTPVAKSIKFVEALEGKDAFDHLAAGHTVEQFVDRSDAIPQQECFEMITLNGTFKPIELDYLWEPYLPLGKAILLDADSGVGKSTVCLAIAAGLSNGFLPNGQGRCEPCKTLYFAADNDAAEEMETVYRANGGREGWISYIKVQFDFNDPNNFTLVERAIKQSGAKFIIFDPFLYYLGRADINDTVAVRPHCQRIGLIAEKYGVAIVAVRHIPKSANQIGGVFGGMGSVQFRASFRGNLFLRPHPEEKGVTVLIDAKGSMLNPRGDTLGFRRRNRYEIEWIVGFCDPFDKSAEPNPVGRPGDQMDAAILQICSLLTIPMRTKELQDKIVPACCSRKTFFRALDKMGIKSSRDGFYSMPPAFDPFGDDDSQEQVYRGGD